MLDSFAEKFHHNYWLRFILVLGVRVSDNNIFLNAKERKGERGGRKREDFAIVKAFSISPNNN